MNKRELKRVVLGALAAELHSGVIQWVPVETDADEERLDAVVDELVDEFQRRSKASE